MLGVASCRHGSTSDSNQVLPGAESMPQRMSQGHRIIGLATERSEADPPSVAHGARPGESSVKSGTCSRVACSVRGSSKAPRYRGPHRRRRGVLECASSPAACLSVDERVAARARGSSRAGSRARPAARRDRDLSPGREGTAVPSRHHRCGAGAAARPDPGCVGGLCRRPRDAVVAGPPCVASGDPAAQGVAGRRPPRVPHVRGVPRDPAPTASRTPGRRRPSCSRRRPSRARSARSRGGRPRRR